MKWKRKYYKLWLHVEQVTTDQNGDDLDYKNLNDEFMPIPLGDYKNKRDLSKAMDAIELTGTGIALLQTILVDSPKGLAHDKAIYELLQSMSRLPKGYKPTW